MSPLLAKKIRLTNLLGLMFSLNMCASAVAFVYFGYYKLAVFCFFFSASELIWPLLNYYYFHGLSRIGMLISSNVLGFTVSIYLPGTEYNHGFFVMAGLPFLLFDLKEKKSLVLGILLPLILFPLSQWGQFALAPYIGSLIIPTETQEFISLSITSVYLILIFFMFWFFSRENFRAEKELAEKRNQAFFSSKFASLGEMASGIAHEINNPMTILHLLVSEIEYMSKERDLKRIDDRVVKLKSTVRRVEKIIESMRSLSRGASRQDMELASISEIVNEALIFCTERFKTHQVELTCEIEQKDFFLKCQSLQITQVLLNLLNNAFDAVSENSKKSIKVLSTVSEEFIYFRVVDNGPGVPEAIREKIFDPFFTTKPVGKGTGLGLSLSKQIIKDHGGRLFLEHGQSGETCFVIKLRHT